MAEEISATTSYQFTVQSNTGGGGGGGGKNGTGLIMIMW